MIDITLLGRVTVCVDGQPIGGEAAQRRRLALLALLCEGRLRPVSRDRLMLHLWPDADAESARRLLSASLYVLRKALGQEAVLTPGDQLQLNADLVRVDTLRFEEAAHGDDPEAALALYGGPFLDGLVVPGSAEYDQWLGERRGELARLHASVLERCAELRTRRGDLEGAVAAWHQLAAHDPYSARTTLGLMHALVATGNRAGALQAARVHAQLLEHEFSASPEPEVLQLAEQLRSEPDGRTTGAAAPDPQRFVGSAVAPATEPRGPFALRAPEPAVPARVLRYIAGAIILSAVTLVMVMLRRPPAPLRIIAVTPRAGVGADSLLDPIAYGIADDIHFELNRSPELHLVNSASSLVYGDSLLDTRQLGRKLDAEGVVLVAARAAGTGVRITVELVRVSSGHVEWENRYDLAQHETARIEAIAREVSAALDVEPDMQAPAAPHGTDDSAAYALNQRARLQWLRREPDALLRARDLFEQALDADSMYAWAWVGLADTYNMLGSYDYGVLAPDSAYPMARAAAVRALHIEPDLAQAHAALANVLANYDWDLPAAEDRYQQALRLNPGYSSAREWLAYVLVARGRIEEARKLLEYAVEYDPSSALVHTDLAHLHYYRRDYPRALAHVKRALEVDSTFGRAHTLHALLLCQTGDAAQAVAPLERMAAARGDRDPVLIALLGYALARSDRASDARIQLARLDALEDRRYVPAEYAALVLVGLGEADPALDRIEEALRRRSNNLLFLAAEPLVEPLHDNPRFQRIIAQIRPR